MALLVTSCSEDESLNVQGNLDILNERYLITQNEAVAFVEEHVLSQKRLASRSDFAVTAFSSEGPDGLPTTHVVNYDSDDAVGWIMVSGDERVSPVLAYGTASNLLEEDLILPGIEEVYTEYRLSVEGIRVGTMDAAAPGNPLVNYAPVPCVETITRPCSDRPPGPGVSECEDSEWTIGPVIEPTWGQNCPYNIPSPDKGCDRDRCGDGRAPAGCVVTAIVQLVAHYEILEGIRYAELETLYEFDEPANLTTANEPGNVVELFDRVAEEVNPNYGCGGTWKLPSRIDNKLEDLGFANGGDRRKWDDYAAFVQLRSGRPMVVEGRQKQFRNWHVWLADGYRDVTICALPIGQRRERRVHYNWGWNGRGNGFYAIDTWQPLDNGRPFNENYDSHNKMITGIRAR